MHFLLKLTPHSGNDMTTTRDFDMIADFEYTVTLDTWNRYFTSRMKEVIDYLHDHDNIKSKCA